MKKMTAEAVIHAAELREAGYTYESIGKELDISRRTAVRWVKLGQTKIPEDATTGKSADKSVLLQSDSITSIEKIPFKLTKEEEKYVEEQKEMTVLYEDPAENWFWHLSDAVIRTYGKVLWVAAIVYEDAPEGWQDRLDATGLEWGESPWHDKDKWDHDSPAGVGMRNGVVTLLKAGEAFKKGDKKKVHKHILVKFSKAEDYRTVARLIRNITHGTYPVRVFNLVGMWNYFLHLGEDNKYPYWKEGDGRICHNGFKPELDKSQRKAVQAQITQVIREEHISDWSDLTKKYGSDSEYTDVIANRAFYFRQCINSEYNAKHPDTSRRAEMKLKQDSSTEIIRTMQDLNDSILSLLTILTTGTIPDDDEKDDD